MTNNMLDNEKKVAMIDENIRKMISDYFFALKEINNPERAVNLLSDHVTIMIEMINDFKNQ